MPGKRDPRLAAAGAASGSGANGSGGAGSRASGDASGHESESSAPGSSVVRSGGLWSSDPLRSMPRAAELVASRAFGALDALGGGGGLKQPLAALGASLCTVSALGLCTAASSALSELAADGATLAERALPAVLAAEAVALRLGEPVAKRFEGRPLQEVLPLLMVGVIMGTIYFAYIVCCVPLSGASFWSPAPLVFHVTFAAALVAYCQGVMTDPGGIPEHWKEGTEHLRSIQNQVQERKQTGEMRFCRKEQKYKPDRAHYCKPLQRNVLRMDHYCPWLSNCVGFYNHKFFVLFLLYTVLATGIALFSIVQSLAAQVLPAGTTAFLLGAAALAALLVVVLAPFLALHAWLLSKNMTTLEFCEQMGSAGGYHSPYDLGPFENCRSVLGSSVALWLLPLGGPDGQGLSFPRVGIAHRDETG